MSESAFDYDQGAVTPPPTSAVRSWVVGFHGILHGDDLDADGRPSLCALALGHRSLGMQRMRELTFLPGASPQRANPRSTNGQKHLGRLAAVPDAPTAERSAPEPPAMTGPRTPAMHVEHVEHADQVAPAGQVEQVELAWLEPAMPLPPFEPSWAAEPPPFRHHSAASALPVPWDPTEPLPDYLERRLGTARFLYLPNRSRAYRIAKRTLDLVGAMLLLLLAAPVMLVIALLIRRDSPGPAIFRQQRVTRGGRVFTFYKFRTMWVDARERYPELYDYQRSGPFSDVFYKLEDDPRNTGVGRWLRRTTLDELPNLVNVIRGEMSLVGPRPELPELLAHYRAEDLALFFTKAGLTGLAQVSGRSLLTVKERITLDLRYVAQQTLLLDLRIIARTVGTVVRSKGAF
jgi:lipopolysaccharide/colanic/teichoic acid biosynthesis glycosyltransferase